MNAHGAQPDNWFTRLCRRSGRAVHELVKPVAHRRTVEHTREERRLDETTILRRTTIDEIEVRREPKDS